MKKEKTPLAEFMYAKRKGLNLTQDFVAKKLGITQKGYSEYECKGRIPKNTLLRKMADILQVDIFDLEELIIEPTYSSVGKLIRIKRRENNITLDELAKIMNFSRKKMIAIELGKEPLTIKIVQNLVKVLQCHFEEFQKCGITVLKSVSEFGRLIREKRIKLNFTQEKIAEELGVTRAAVSLFETEAKPKISQSVLKKLCSVLDIHMDDVMHLLPNKRRIKNDVKKFGYCIKILREAKQMFQSELAKKVNLSETSISNIENGYYNSISVELLEKFSSVLDCKKEDLESADFKRISKQCEFIKKQEQEKIRHFGKNIYMLRVQRGLTVKELSKKTKLSLNTIKSIEKGSVQKINPAWIEIFSKHLECEKEILTNSETEKVAEFIRKTDSCEDSKTLGAFVKAKRKEMELEKEDLAKKTKLSLCTISKIEDDKFETLRLLTLGKLASALKCDVPILQFFLHEEVEKPSSLGTYIKDLRIKKGLSQAALAKKADLHYKTVCDIEHDKVQKPNKETLKKIARVLSCKIDDLEEFTKNKGVLTSL